MINRLKLVDSLNQNLNKAEKANCFNAIQLYWKDTSHLRFIGPEEFVSYVALNFDQVSLEEKLQEGNVTIVWTRTSNFLPVGQIRIGDIVAKKEGYPFGLIIEHAFVEIDGLRVFQKPDPKPSSLYEIIDREEALKPYLTLNGFEITRHRRR